MHYIYILSLLLLFCTQTTYAQRSYGGKPAKEAIGYLKSSQQISFKKLPEIDTDSLIAAKKTRQESVRFKSHEYGINQQVNLRPEKQGTWSQLPCGSWIWRLGITSDGAKSLSLLFDTFALKRGTCLFIYDPEYTSVLGAFTHKNNNPGGILRTAEIPGDKLIIELQVPGTPLSYGKLSIAKVGHAYIDIFKNETDMKSSGWCQIDINCPKGDNWQSEKRSVVKYTYTNGGNYHCSGALINNTLNNGTPNLITARHCISNDTRAATTVFYFNYEKDVCDGTLYNTGQTLAGATVKSTVYGLDYTLLRLDDIVPISYDPYFSGYNAFDVQPQSSVGIHHPRGDAKKIAIDYDPAVSKTAVIDGFTFNAFAHWKILEWDEGTTEGGSSGSPQYDQDHYIVGTLSGGDAKCDDPVNDYYSKIASAWNTGSTPSTRLKEWLDPSGNNIRKHEAWDPMLTPCDTLSNYPDSTYFFDISLSNPESGYVAGHNSLSHSMYAEYYPIALPLSLNGVGFYTGDIYSGSPLDILTIKIWNAAPLPDSLLFEKDVFISDLSDQSYNYIDFEEFIPITSDFFIGYEIYYNQQDSLNVLLIQHQNDSLNTAYLFDPSDSNWYAYSDYYSGSYSFAMEIVKCYWTPQVSIKNIQEYPKKNSSFRLYPNPASDILTLELEIDETPLYASPSNITIYNMAGQIIQTSTTHNKKTNIDIQTIPEGMYILQLQNQEGVCTERFIIQRAY